MADYYPLISRAVGALEKKHRIDREAPDHHLGHVAPVASGENDPLDTQRFEITEQGLRAGRS